jgi:hypothetical protein
MLGVRDTLRGDRTPRAAGNYNGNYGSFRVAAPAMNNEQHQLCRRNLGATVLLKSSQEQRLPVRSRGGGPSFRSREDVSGTVQQRGKGVKQAGRSQVKYVRMKRRWRGKGIKKVLLSRSWRIADKRAGVRWAWWPLGFAGTRSLHAARTP